MKQNFNDNWICYPKNEEDRAVRVTLPHDAMQSDPRSETSPGGEIRDGMRRGIMSMKKTSV